MTQNAYRMAEAQLGFPPQCYYAYDWIGAPCNKYENGSCVEYGQDVNPTNQTSDCVVLRKELEKIYKVVKVCDGNALRDGCIPAYKGNDTVLKESNPDLDDTYINQVTSGCGGFRESSIHNNSLVWNLADGTIIIWYSGMLFALDINGMKGPNKWGHDLFTFNIFKGANKALKINPMSGGCSIVEKGGVTSLKMVQTMY